MSTSQYTVTVSADWTVSAETVQSTLLDCLPFNSYLNVSVDEVPSENTKVLGKISAIKRIRQALQCSLTDAKFLTDSAVTLGTARWSGVIVTYVLEDSLTGLGWTVEVPEPDKQAEDALAALRAKLTGDSYQD